MGRSPPVSSRSMYWSSDRKSTRLNSSHLVISYAVFCLKKKNHFELARFPKAETQRKQVRQQGGEEVAHLRSCLGEGQTPRSLHSLPVFSVLRQCVVQHD